jgi:hypothetical protein
VSLRGATIERVMADVIDLAAARERLADDQYATATVSTELPVHVAAQLLSENGWRVGDGPFGGSWTAPDGRTIYGIDDALQIALIAEPRPERSPSLPR